MTTVGKKPRLTHKVIIEIDRSRTYAEMFQMIAWCQEHHSDRVWQCFHEDPHDKWTTVTFSFDRKEDAKRFSSKWV